MSAGVGAFVAYRPATGHTLVVLSNYHDSALPLIEALPRQFERYYGDAALGEGAPRADSTGLQLHESRGGGDSKSH